MSEEWIVGYRALPEGFEFHLSSLAKAKHALCGQEIVPTQIPHYFFGVESAIEGRWCAQCESLSRAAAQAKVPAPAAQPGDAPCV